MGVLSGLCLWWAGFAAIGHFRSYGCPWWFVMLLIVSGVSFTVLGVLKLADY